MQSEMNLNTVMKNRMLWNNMENLSQELPTEKQRHVDSLLDSLQMVCRIHGNAISKDALIAGLPLQNGRLTPSLVERAGQSSLQCPEKRTWCCSPRIYTCHSITWTWWNLYLFGLGWKSKRCAGYLPWVGWSRGAAISRGIEKPLFGLCYCCQAKV